MVICMPINGEGLFEANVSTTDIGEAVESFITEILFSSCPDYYKGLLFAVLRDRFKVSRLFSLGVERVVVL